MRFLKFLFVLVLIGSLIAGGIFYTTNMLGWDWSQIWMMAGQQGVQGDHQQMQQMQGGEHAGGHGAVQQAGPFNVLANQNRDKLTQALTSLNQAMELVTSDPYAQITMPNRMSDYPRDGGMAPGTPNAAQRDGVTININPNAPQTTPSKLPDLPTTQNIVFDQNKLEMLHNGIFKLSQAMMLLNDLNNDLIDQSLMNESNMLPQQVYTVRYALIAQNRAKISQANRLLQEAFILANVNPYAPQSGYIYNTQKMQQLHQGISELGRSSVMLNRLLDDLNQQLTQTAYEAKVANAGMQAAPHGAMGNSSPVSGIVINLAVAVIVFAFIVWMLTMIRKMVRESTRSSSNSSR